ncbi:MAG: U32 family peptidase [Brevinematales bacterium]
MKTIELLAPARDLDCGLAAVNCGADAVYIGAGRYGARFAASNSIDSVEKLSSYAHRFRAKVYLALNTILFDNEIDDALKIAWEAYEAGADGLIIQDMGLLETDLPPVPLIASTQADNSDWRKIKFLEETGFKRAILARELTLEEIALIHGKTSIELECFVHGALCVSYSGRCNFGYASLGRSSNRGVCSQPCRMKYTLKDGAGKVIEKDRYLLSLRDLDLSSRLGDLLNAGVTSFKIEGRLKGEDYVKNIVSYYRLKIDEALGSAGMEKSSEGECVIDFIPDPDKTFRRGATEFFIDGRKPGLATLNTQKSTGELIGRVSAAGADYFALEPTETGLKVPALQPGDGICYYDGSGVLCGGVINGTRDGLIYPLDARFITVGAEIYRNHNHEFGKKLDKGSIRRLIPVRITCSETAGGFYIQAQDGEGIKAGIDFKFDKVKARNGEDALMTLRKQLGKLGGTIYRAKAVDIDLKEIPFLPVSSINMMRRELLAKLDLERASRMPGSGGAAAIKPNSYPYPEEELDYTYNVLNDKARQFYFRHGVKNIEPAAESGLPMEGKRIMKCRYCIKFELGLCGSDTGELTLTDGRSDPLVLKFNCEGPCFMEIYKARRAEAI